MFGRSLHIKFLFCGNSVHELETVAKQPEPMWQKNSESTSLRPAWTLDALPATVISDPTPTSTLGDPNFRNKTGNKLLMTNSDKVHPAHAGARLHWCDKTTLIHMTGWNDESFPNRLLWMLPITLILCFLISKRVIQQGREHISILTLTVKIRFFSKSVEILTSFCLPTNGSVITAGFTHSCPFPS